MCIGISSVVGNVLFGRLQTKTSKVFKTKTKTSAFIVVKVVFAGTESLIYIRVYIYKIIDIP